LGETLSEAELSKCQHFVARSYRAFRHPIRINPLTGANALDIAQLGADEALLTTNATQLAEAYGHARAELTVVHTAKTDGIRGDGVFGILPTLTMSTT